MQCPKCRVELNPMRIFGWADLYLCSKCNLAYDEKSLDRYQQQLLALAAPVPDGLGRSSARR